MRVRLGIRDIIRAACEAHDAIDGPSLGAAVLAIVRERPRLHAIIHDLRAGVDRLKAKLAKRDETEASLSGAKYLLRTMLDGKQHKVSPDAPLEVLLHEVQGYVLELEGEKAALEKAAEEPWK